MAAFPSNFKPTISQGYSFGAPQDVIDGGVTGGDVIQARDYKFGSTLFNISMALDPLRMQVWQDFYFGKLSSGSNKFTMNLDSGNGIEEHIVMIQPGSVDFEGSGDPKWRLNFTLIADRISFQGGL